MANKPGLSYTDEEADAPSAAVTDSTQNIGSNIGASVEMGKGKGINVAGKIPLGAADTTEMLSKMQAILDERSSPMNTFLGGLQRASAWGSGGVNGPHAALTAMDQQKQAEQQNTLGMQQTMAAMKAQQAARQRFAENVGYGQPAAAAQPGVAAQPGMQIPNYQNVIMNLPQSMRASALTAIQNGDETTWNTILQAAEKNRTPESRNLEQIQNMPEGSDKQMFTGQTFEKGIAPRSYIGPGGKTYQYSPAVGMPGAAPAPTGGGVNLRQVALNAGIPADAIISDYRDPTKQLSLIDHEDPKNPGKYLTKEGRPVALPGQSPHQVPGGALDLRSNYQITPVQKKALLQAGAVEVPGDPGHYQLPMSKINAALAANTSAAAAPNVSKEDLELNQKALEKSSESFHSKEGVYADVTKRGLAADKREQLADQALNNIKGNAYGPGTELGQSFAKFAQMAGVKLNPKEMDKYIGNLNIENARKFLSAESARAAMGAQFTAPEADAWLKAFAGIDNPKEYLKNFYQIEKAGALVDKDLHRYLLKNRGREQDAYLEWQDSGAKDRIMRENVDAFKTGKPTSEATTKPAAQKPATAPASAKQADDGNWYAPDPKRPGKYLMWKAQ